MNTNSLQLEIARLERKHSENERLIKDIQYSMHQEELERERLELERLQTLRHVTYHRIKELEEIIGLDLESIRLEKERLMIARLRNERLKQERFVDERMERERLDTAELIEELRLLTLKERLDRESAHLERERLENEHLVRERMNSARLERERYWIEKMERDRMERLRFEDERLKKDYERLERANQRAHEDNERLKQDRIDRAKRREREQEAYRDHLRQQAQRGRERSQKRQRRQEDRGGWGQSWTRYQEEWVSFKASASRETNIRDAIPWPVKSGSYRDVTAANVKEFFNQAVPSDANLATLMKKECLKWHPDKINSLLRDFQLSRVDKAMVDMICGVITDSLNSCAGRSSNFLG
jgi:hypothetical protein